MTCFNWSWHGLDGKLFPFSQVEFEKLRQLPKAPDWEIVHSHLALSGRDFSLALSLPPPLAPLTSLLSFQYFLCCHLSSFGSMISSFLSFIHLEVIPSHYLFNYFLYFFLLSLIFQESISWLLGHVILSHSCGSQPFYLFPGAFSELTRL